MNAYKTMWNRQFKVIFGILFCLCLAILLPLAYAVKPAYRNTIKAKLNESLTALNNASLMTTSHRIYQPFSPVLGMQEIFYFVKDSINHLPFNEDVIKEANGSLNLTALELRNMVRFSYDPLSRELSFIFLSEDPKLSEKLSSIYVKQLNAAMKERDLETLTKNRELFQSSLERPDLKEYHSDFKEVLNEIDLKYATLKSPGLTHLDVLDVKPEAASEVVEPKRKLLFAGSTLAAFGIALVAAALSQLWKKKSKS